ncbi:N-acetylglucosamine-6-phosphate deacetylase [Bacillus sp. DJP31]|uniref:N-acetylglucosamine-6-phosphate deacetylase n=1 Tax=Bacillus sp. DJP31 TaxID=3409789 RepID=UPI003BB55AD8
MKKRILLKGGTVYQLETIRPNCSLLIENGKIQDIGESISEDVDEVKEIPEGYHVIPGMIDIHIHGAAGHDAMDATLESLKGMCHYLPSEGVTGFLPTTMTQSIETIEQALSTIASYTRNEELQDGAEVLGVHLEGPFLSEKRAGAQPVKYMLEADAKQFQRWQELSGDQIKIVTLAPEKDKDFRLIQHLHSTGVVASVGHCDAAYEVFAQAVDHGLSHATHLYNQMRGIHHREPGVVGGVYLHDNVTAELIVDGIHVSPEMIKLTTKIKGFDSLIMITDSMRAKGLAEGVYELGGQKVKVENGEARLEDGTLAGSILRMDEALSNIMSYTGCSLLEVVRMTSYNSACKIGVLDRKGSLEVGKDADIVVLNKDYQVVMTFCLGKLVYHQEF